MMHDVIIIIISKNSEATHYSAVSVVYYIYFMGVDKFWKVGGLMFCV